jgi:hypothetical protein
MIGYLMGSLVLAVIGVAVTQLREMSPGEAKGDATDAAREAREARETRLRVVE